MEIWDQEPHFHWDTEIHQLYSLISALAKNAFAQIRILPLSGGYKEEGTEHKSTIDTIQSAQRQCAKK